MISISPELSSRISILSFVCACMVVLIHVPVPSSVGSVGWFLSSIFFYGICLISVPFFLIISGFFLGRHLDENGWYKNALRKRVKSLLIPYIIFNTLYWTVTHLNLDQWNIHNVVMGIVGTPFGTPSLGPTWYIRSLLIFVIITPLLPQSRKMLIIGGGIAFMIAAVFLILSDSYPDIKIIKFLKHTCSMQNLFYFIAGLIISKKDDFHISREIASIAAIVALVILVVKVVLELKGFFMPTMWRLAFCTLALIAFWKLFPELNIGKNITSLAFPVFLIHYFFLIILQKWNIDYNDALGFVGSYMFMQCSSICVCMVIRKFFPKKIVSLIFGGR